MNIDEIVKLLDAITKLLNVLVWPGIFLFILIRFRPELREFFINLSDVSLKAAGIDLSMKRKQTEAAAALAAAAVSRSDEGLIPETTAREARVAANIVAEAVTPQIIKRAGRSTVLWVDDRPKNNINERQSLEALGVSFELATSTEEALKKLEQQHFDAIISDMKRPSDPLAGYTLLDKLRSEGDQTPFIIYAGSRVPEHVAEARRRGAVGCTSRPNELFKMVLSALGRGA